MLLRKRKPLRVPEVATSVDPAESQRAKALADQEYAQAERQSYEAEIVVNRLVKVNNRNGFSPALEATFRRRLGGI